MSNEFNMILNTRILELEGQLEASKEVERQVCARVRWLGDGRLWCGVV